MHNEELHGSHSSPNMIRMIIARMMGWGRHVTCMEVTMNVYTILVGEVKKMDQLRTHSMNRWY